MNTTSTTTASASASASSSSEQCESGWTLYLDYSTQFHNNAAKSHHQIPCCEVRGDSRFYNHHHNDEDDEEEDLSMVSDASSGPPHLEEEEAAEDIFCSGGSGGRKRRTSSEISRNVKLGRRRFEREDFALDDTASSHPMMNVIFSSKKNGGVENQASPIKGLIDYSSQGFSATHFQVVVESRKRR